MEPNLRPRDRPIARSPAFWCESGRGTSRDGGAHVVGTSLVSAGGFTTSSRFPAWSSPPPRCCQASAGTRAGSNLLRHPLLQQPGGFEALGAVLVLVDADDLAVA